jgi:activin receptor type-1
MECCTGDYCNNGSFPYLPPLPAELPVDSATDDLIRLCFAIFGPIIIVGVIASVVILFLRRNQKKRLVDARIQQDADTYYASDDLLKRTHACGDSTLRVSLCRNVCSAKD